VGPVEPPQAIRKRVLDQIGEHRKMEAPRAGR
jgi:hypothetical protein